MDEEKRKELLDAARTIRDICEKSDCDDCPFDRNLCNRDGDWSGPPCGWELPNE